MPDRILAQFIIILFLPYSEYDLPHSPPFTCPFPRCEKKHKVRSKLAIHYAVTHKVLKRYFEEEKINLGNKIEKDTSDFDEESTSSVINKKEQQKSIRIPSNRTPRGQHRQCELCGLKFKKSPNAYQEHNLHLFHKHFKEKFYNENYLPQSPPYVCPWQGCKIVSKVRSKLAIHIARTHKVLKRYLEEEINRITDEKDVFLPENSDKEDHFLSSNEKNKNNSKQFSSESSDDDDSWESSNELKTKIDDFDKESISLVPKKKRPRPKPKCKKVVLNPSRITKTNEEEENLSEFEELLTPKKPQKRIRLMSRDDDSGIFNDNSSVISATKREHFEFSTNNDVTIGSDFEYSRRDENVISDDSIENNIGMSENLGLVHKFPQTSVINENEITHEGTIIKREKHSTSTNQIFVCPICELEGIYKSLHKALNI